MGDAITAFAKKTEAGIYRVLNSALYR